MAKKKTTPSANVREDRIPAPVAQTPAPQTSGFTTTEEAIFATPAPQVATPVQPQTANIRESRVPVVEQAPAVTTTPDTKDEKEPKNAQGKGAAEALAFGLTDALIKAFPELQKVYDLFVQEKYADARLAYYETKYYKDLTGTSSSRKTDKATRPGVYAQEFDAWKQSQKVRLTSKGITVTPDIEAMLEDSYLKGDTDLQLDLRIVNSGKFGTIGGSTLGSVGVLKKQAYEQGVDTLFGADYWSKVSQGLFSGTTTVTDIEEQIKNTAISAYPAYAEGIKAGKSFNLLTSALRKSVANILEIDEDLVSNDNPAFKQLVNYVNPTTQKPEQIPLWEAEKVLKKRDEWLYTKNAMATFDSLGRAVLKDMGVAY